MSKFVFVLGLILLSLFVSGKSSDIDCAKVPIENVEPCKDFLSKKVSVTRPSDECCKGAKSWIGAPQDAVCKCYKKSPDRLSFTPDEIRVAALPYLCKSAELYTYVPCLV
ncbi:non-specific lipid-transfer protein-like protein at2g13820 [Phtheirospermum japonicum]|uniref:Non-specific lipid-transfer protein-like protein at2g13820 n=1 Tax=Phtheirospermum japonicum TaxID=374723 RepID=A0A830CF61_9LAMI|nr:non-specific lipid-transfer protein-like protein at2g13820 [Phtheirospermum japonicum]